MSESELLVFGGWSVKGLDATYTFDCLGGAGFKEHGSTLAKADFFLNNGCVSKVGSELKFTGHHSLHTFDLRTKKFGVVAQSA